METKRFYSREENDVAAKVKAALLEGNVVEWNTEYETFYGCSWASWATKQLTDIDCIIEYKNWDAYEGYYRTLLIKPSSK